MLKQKRNNKILVLSDDPISDRVAGLGMRYLEIAKALSKEHDITLFSTSEITGNIKDLKYLSAPVFRTINLGIKILLPNSKLKKEILEYDAILTQGITLTNLGLLTKFKKPILFDLYCPWFFENLEAQRNLGHKIEKINLKPLLNILRRGDFFTCANEKQRDLYLGLLAATGRITPQIYKEDPALRNLIDIVPTGLSSVSPQPTQKALKGIHPGIGERDKVLMWWGGIWDWLDPFSLLHAMPQILAKRKDLKLVFFGIKHPSLKQAKPSAAEKCLQLAKELNLYNKNVFFLEEWAPYAERGNWLLESDLGIMTYTQNLETRFSWRTRVLDYLWADLPVIISEGDAMADLVKNHNLGRVVKSSDPASIARAILELLDHPEEYSKIKRNIQNFKPQLNWENTIIPIHAFLQKCNK